MAVAPARAEEEMDKVNEYVKVAEAAEILGVSQNTVRTWAEKGVLKVQRNPANGWLFRRSDLETFLERLGSDAGGRPPKTRQNADSH